MFDEEEVGGGGIEVWVVVVEFGGGIRGMGVGSLRRMLRFCEIEERRAEIFRE